MALSVKRSTIVVPKGNQRHSNDALKESIEFKGRLYQYCRKLLEVALSSGNDHTTQKIHFVHIEMAHLRPTNTISLYLILLLLFVVAIVILIIFCCGTHGWILQSLGRHSTVPLENILKVILKLCVMLCYLLFLVAIVVVMIIRCCFADS